MKSGNVLTGLLVLLSAFSTHKSFGYSVSDILRDKTKPGPCTKKYEVTESRLDLLASIASERKLNRKYCEAIAYFDKIIINTDNAKQLSWALSEKIESSFFQYDYNAVFQDAEYFITKRPSSEFEEKVRLTLVKAVHELAAQDPKLDNGWFQFALGIQIEQMSSESFKANYSILNFIQKYPNSPEVPVLRSWLQELQQGFTVNLISDARKSRMRRDYVPAIVRYQSILKQGPTFPDFSVCVFELIQTLSEFSFFAEDPTIVPNHKLAIWMMTTEDLITNDSRTRLKVQLDSQARALYKKLIDEMPNDPWTERARHEFGF